MRPLLVSVLSLSLPIALPAEAAPEKVLFIGNSYTSQIRSMVTAFFGASPHKDVKMDFITPGGRTLEQHAEIGKTLAAIADGGWDIVVLQDQSQTPAVFPKKFLAAAADLNAAITKAGAKTAYYATWGRRDGDKQNARLFPTFTEMQDALSQSYQAAAERDDGILVAVGEAWRSVRTERPQLGSELYRGDGSHPSAKGAYLAACCFYAALTGNDPREVNFDGGLPAEVAEYLREKAFGSASIAPVAK